MNSNFKQESSIGQSWTIAVVSRGRPNLLRCVEKILEQVQDHEEIEIEVKIYLNNVQQYDSRVGQLAAVVEWIDTTGVADARNFVLTDCLRRRRTHTLFFDDDQIPMPNWLQAFVVASRCPGYDAYLGPVEAGIPVSAPSWARESPQLFRGVANQPNVAGRHRGPAYSGNTLVRLSAVSERALFFSTELNAGGEDTEFFHRLVQAGGTIFWVPQAKAIELQDDSRLSITGLAIRNYRKGQVARRLERRGVFAGSLPGIVRHPGRLILQVVHLLAAFWTRQELKSAALSSLMEIVFLCGVVRESLRTNMLYSGVASQVRDEQTRPHPGHRFSLCGVAISTLTLEEATSHIIASGVGREGIPVHLCNTYTLSLVDADAILREALNSRYALNLPDGTPIAWMGPAGYSPRSPVRGPGLMRAVIRRGCPVRLTHYFYGGKEGVAEKLTSRLIEEFPDVRIAGSETPPFSQLSESEMNALVSRIRSSGSAIVWIGLGTPRQDYLVEELWKRGLTDTVLIPVGAAFDFLSGEVQEAPKWLHGSGLEWLYRLSQEPRRLWRRYTIGIIKFGLCAVFHRHKNQGS